MAFRPLATVTGPVGFALTNSRLMRGPVAAGRRPHARPASCTVRDLRLKRALGWSRKFTNPGPATSADATTSLPFEGANERLGDDPRGLAGLLGSRHRHVGREVAVLGSFGSLDRPGNDPSSDLRVDHPGVGHRLERRRDERSELGRLES
jgi:hypothetical protein